MAMAAAEGRPGPGLAVGTALLVTHLLLARDRAAELRLALVAGATGLVIDSALVGLDLVSYASGTVVPGLCPPWIVVMWMQFSTMLRFSLRWLIGHPYLTASLGAVGGPLAYLAGDRLGAVDLATPPATSLIALGVVWSVVVPLLLDIARRHPARGYRWEAPPAAGRRR